MAQKYYLKIFNCTKKSFNHYYQFYLNPFHQNFTQALDLKQRVDNTELENKGYVLKDI